MWLYTQGRPAKMEDCELFDNLCGGDKGVSCLLSVAAVGTLAMPATPLVARGRPREVGCEAASGRRLAMNLLGALPGFQSLA